MIFAKPTPAERARGCCFYTELESPAAIAAQGGVVAGVYRYERDHGMAFANPAAGNSVTFGADSGQPFATGIWSAVIEFWPSFAAGDGAAHDLVASTAASRCGVVKTAANALSLYRNGAAVGSAALGVYEPYWRVNQRNVVVAVLTGAGTRIYLNGVQVATSGTAQVPITYAALAIGSTTTGTELFAGYIQSVRLFKHNVVAECLSLPEAADYYNNQTFNYPQRAVCLLPMTADTHDPSHAMQANDVDQTQLLVDGDMEAVGIAAWTVAGAGAVVQKTAGTRPGGTGTKVLQIIRAGAAATATQTILTVGQRYRVTGWARGDGVASWPRVVGTVALWSGTTSATWQYCDFIFTAAGTSLGLWNHTDDGTCEFDDFTVRLSADLLSDGLMEQVDADQWTPGNAATLTKSLTTPQAGLRCLRVAYGGVNDPYATQTILTVGKRYHCEGYARGDTVRVPSVLDGAVVLWTGTAANTWQRFSVDFTATTTGIRFQSNAVAAGYCEFDTCSLVQLAARTLDVSGHGNHFWLGNDGTTVASMPTKAATRGYTFAAAHWLRCPRSLGIPGSHTVAFWATINTTATNNVFALVNSAGTTGWGYQQTSTLRRVMHNNGGSGAVLTTPLLGNPNFYCFVFNSSGNVVYNYLNGTYLGTTAALTVANGWNSGAIIGAIASLVSTLTGTVYQFGVWPFMLTATQIADRYLNGLRDLSDI